MAAPKKDPLILTVSELSELTAAEKQAFRDKGGTVVNDPVQTAPAPDPAPAPPAPK